MPCALAARLPGCLLGRGLGWSVNGGPRPFLSHPAKSLPQRQAFLHANLAKPSLPHPGRHCPRTLPALAPARIPPTRIHPHACIAHRRIPPTLIPPASCALACLSPAYLSPAYISPAYIPPACIRPVAAASQATMPKKVCRYQVSGTRLPVSAVRLAQTAPPRSACMQGAVLASARLPAACDTRCGLVVTMRKRGFCHGTSAIARCGGCGLQRPAVRCLPTCPLAPALFLPCFPIWQTSGFVFVFSFFHPSCKSSKHPRLRFSQPCNP